MKQNNLTYELMKDKTKQKLILGNVQISCDASEGRRSFAQTVRLPSYGGEELWPNRHITFIVAEKV